MAPGGSGAAIMDGPEHLERIRTACLKDADRRTQKQLQDIFQLLGKVSFFDQFPTAAVWDLTRVAQLYVTKAWEVVFRQGQPGEAVFFCIDGLCDVHKSDDNLHPVPASESGPSKEHQKAATKMAAKRKWSYVRSVFSINKLGQKTFNPEVLSESKEKEVESVEKEFGKCLVRLRSGSTFGEVALLRKVKRTAARKRRFEVIWEASEELYHDGCGDWCQKQLLCVPCCCYYPDYYKLTASTLVLTQKANRKIGSINFTKEKKVRNIDLSNMRGVSAMHAHNILSCGCDADEVFIDLDAEAGLDHVHPLYVKAGEGEKVAEIINMAMEENQAMEAMVMERD